jgi:YgiT-type zinc finger domain-containing protein
MPGRCPLCGGLLASKMAEVEVKRGSKKKIIKVPAEICQKCGERIYSRQSEEMIIRAEQELLSD